MLDEARGVLVADDDASTRALVAEVLSAEFGVAVSEACDGHEAIAAVNLAPPALILLDLTMPRLDGFAVLHWLKSSPRTATIPVLVLTAAANAAALQALERRCDGLIAKPFDLDDLLVAVDPFLHTVTRPPAMVELPV